MSDPIKHTGAHSATVPIVTTVAQAVSDFLNSSPLWKAVPGGWVPVSSTPLPDLDTPLADDKEK